MKRLIITVLFGVGLGAGAWAAPQQIYLNYGTITTPPMVDATSFVNEGIFSFNTVTVNSNFTYPIGDNTASDALPYSSRDTLYYTNTTSGIMAATNGFDFETITETTVHSASQFVNDGAVTGFDYPASADTYSTTAGTTAIPAGSVPVAGHVDVLSTNILNDGTISVGNAGLLQLTGSNVNTVNGALVAGAVSTGDPDEFLNFFTGSSVSSAQGGAALAGTGGRAQFDTLDTTGGTVDVFGLNSFFVDPPNVYDLYWGDQPVSGNPLALNGFSPPNTTSVYSSFRESEGGQEGFGLPLTANPLWSTNVYTYDLDASNTYFNIVFVNTNFFDVNGQLDANITATVGFTDTRYIQGGRGGDTNGNQEIYVQFALPTYDVVTAQVVTNAIYLADVGGILDTMSMDYNASSADNFGRPNAFSITTTTPSGWLDCLPANTNYDPSLIYEAGNYLNEDVPYSVAAYGVQIGRNPAQVDGSFNFDTLLTDLSAGSFNGISFNNGLDYVVLPDPTNEGARIELNANQLNLSNSRLRAEGMVIMNATNFIGQTAGSDWGEINAQLGSTNGSLVISNVFPTNFQRLRGDIYAYCVNFVNVFTNGTTNTFHYHILVVDQNLGGNFHSAIRNLGFTGTNAINVQDSLYVINQSYFNTTSLTLNSNAVFTQNAGNLTPTNMPKLKYFLNNTNGNLMVDNLLDFGYDVTKTPVAPTGRKYSVLAVTNFGQMTATEPLFQSELFENDGSIVADSNGSIIIEAASLGMGLALTNATNALIADGNVTLSAVAMGIVNSVITNGANGNPGLLTLQSTLNGEITDFTSSAPSTNTPLVNFWEVTDGFSLPVKPATGDLFGTKITTTTTNFTVAVHTWAGVDLGATSEGFSDNMVIGHLKLSRMSANSVLRFTGAGVQNAMYVDYLELDPNSLSYGDYRDGLIIDPNLTIYFAGCNVDPLKLETVYTNRLVWVPSFAGPNSTVAVPIYGTTNFCLMNSNVAFSQDISSSDSGIPNFNNQPYVLHNPITGSDAPCPGAVTTFKDFIVENGISITNGMTLQIAASGAGVVKPNLKQNQIALGKTYSLTATPSNGWVFSGWSTAGLPAGMSTTSRTLKFQLNNTVSVTAIFTPKAFTLTKGTYHGLFMDPSVIPTPANSGSFTLAVNSGGEFSGRLLMGPTNYTFSDKFPTNGIVQVSAKHGSQSQLMELQLDTTGQTGQVTGYVGTPAVHLLGDLAPVWTAHDPSPYFGQYTIALTNGGTNAAKYGDSYGTLTVSKQGILSVGGVLADGASFSQSVPVSKNGMWPFYTYVPASRDRLLGWVSFQGTDLFGATLGQTNVFWTKGPSRGRYYPEGFSDTFNLVGSPYSNPGKNASGLTLVDPVAVLTGGGLAAPAMLSLTYDGKLTYATNDFNLTIKPTQGIISGRLETSGGDPVIKLQGVVLQNQNAAFGFFLGTNDESGAVLLESQ